MLNLSSDDRQQLREAIQSAYPAQEDLEIFVDEKLNRNLAVIASGGKLSTIVYKLIQWAIAKGYIDDLILALAKDTGNRADIQVFCAHVLRQRMVLNVSSDAIDELEPNIWGLDVTAEELELFLPKRFTFEADVGILQQGLELASAVCKITFADRPSTESGTGVLVAPGYVLTNYHVLSFQSVANLNEVAQTMQFEFGYVSTQFGEAPRTQVLTVAGAEPVVSFSPIEELDYALIRLSPSKDFTVQPVPLNSTGQIAPRSPLNILQHPAGVEMKVSLSNNGVVKTNEEKGLVLYVNPSKGGSSGSPCFDMDWKLVALHHKQIQTSFGSLREGILFRSIYRHINDFASVVVF
jgi:endonuclease G, mitochondrial